MVHKRFFRNDSIKNTIKMLEGTTSFEEAIAYLHILGKVSIGLASSKECYRDYDESVRNRMDTLMNYADMAKEVVFPTATTTEALVREKALSSLAGLFKAGDSDYGMMLYLKRVEILKLLKFFSICDNVPHKEPEKRYVRDFLLGLYYRVWGGFKEHPKPPYVFSNLLGELIDIHGAVIRPLILFGEVGIFLEQKDRIALGFIKDYIKEIIDLDGKQVYTSLEDVLAYKVVSEPEFEIAAVGIGLGKLFAAQTELQLSD